MCVFFAGLFFLAGLFNTQFDLSAQTPDDKGKAPPAAGPILDESALILGENPAIPPPAGGSSVFIMLRMILVLALAALAIYGVVFFIKRLARPREAQNPHLKILARTALSNDTFAAVIAVGNKAWLVAGGSGNVNLISEINDNDSLETMLLNEERRASESGAKPFIDFRSLLQRQRDRLKGP